MATWDLLTLFLFANCNFLTPIMLLSVFHLPYIPAYNPPIFGGQKFGEGAYTMNIKRKPFFQNQNFGMT